MSITQVTFKTWICEELIFIQTLFLQCFPGIFQKPVNAYVASCDGLVYWIVRAGFYEPEPPGADSQSPARTSVHSLHDLWAHPNCTVQD